MRFWQRVPVTLAVLLAAAGCAEERTTVPTTLSTGVASVVSAAVAFVKTLDDGQRQQVQLGLTRQNATAWSDQPCGSACRVGIDLGSLDDEQLTAALAVLRAAMGTGGGTGYDQAMQIVLADDVLAGAAASGAPVSPAATTPPATIEPPASATASAAAQAAGAVESAGDGTGGYSSGAYFLGLLGDPGMSGEWQLHFGGHHLAVTIAYRDGAVAGASPYFAGAEPVTWTDKGVTYAPLDVMRTGMLELFASLTPEQLGDAQLAEAPSDVLAGPGRDDAFPEKKQGVQVKKLAVEQKDRVMSAIHRWVAVADDGSAQALLQAYRFELDDTRIAWSGGTALDAPGQYARIDGPRVWIEFAVVPGSTGAAIAYHSVYRDHERDYGGAFTTG